MQLYAPSLPVCAELVGSLACGCALNAVLGWCCVRASFVTLVFGLGLLGLPHVVPFRYGLSATAFALVIVVGVWKVIDVHRGTRPDAVVRTAADASMHFLSPVEYRVDARGDSLRAPPGLWRVYASHGAWVYCGLGVAASAHAACGSSGTGPHEGASMILRLECFAINYVRGPIHLSRL